MSGWRFAAALCVVLVAEAFSPVRMPRARDHHTASLLVAKARATQQAETLSVVETAVKSLGAITLASLLIFHSPDVTFASMPEPPQQQQVASSGKKN